MIERTTKRKAYETKLPVSVVARVNSECAKCKRPNADEFTHGTHDRNLNPATPAGLTYMRARYYEPWTGRFISEDPARDGWNWFVYTGNNPTNKVDRSGKAAQLVIGVLILIFFLAFAINEGFQQWQEFGEIVSWERVLLMGIKGVVLCIVATLGFAAAAAVFPSNPYLAVAIGVVVIIFGLKLDEWMNDFIDEQFPFHDPYRDIGRRGPNLNPW